MQLNRLMLSSAAYSGRYASILEGYAVTPAQVEKDVFYVADQDGTIVAFYCLTLDGEPELDLMFVADSVQGAGLGSSMFRHMRDQARRRGISAIKIVSHPPSVDFYKKMGATVVGMKAAALKARWERPILMFSIDD